LMYRRIRQSPVSVGDLAAWLDEELSQKKVSELTTEGLPVRYSELPTVPR